MSRHPVRWLPLFAALIVGTVSDLTPSRSYVVQTGASVVVGGVTPIEGRNVYPIGGVPGSPDAQIIASAASVGLTARMVDVKTGAMRSITQSFVDSLVSVWPSLIKPKS